MNQYLADNLRKLRLNAKMSQTEVAKRIKISLSSYSRFERSEVKVDLATAIKIADFYKITLDELLHMDDPDYKAHEPKSVYAKRWTVNVTVSLDGTKETLQMWIDKLTAINAAI
jgi:transcriptional regulator with XRE-family HTH domain